MSGRGPRRSLSPHSLWTLERAIFAPEASLKADEAASTIFRFFRSKHVIDLRLITYLVGLLFACHLVYACHKADSAYFAAYFAPAIPLYGAVIAWAYLAAGTRLGVVDLFACEISTLCRVAALFDVGNRYVDLYRSKGDAKEKHAAAKHAAMKHVAGEETPRSYTSQENYFPIFDNNSGDLKSLEALVVTNITEYYTYMKAVRDLQRRLATIEPSNIPEAGDQVTNGSRQTDLLHETLANIVYVLYLGHESARNAINDLIEFEPTRAEDTIIILLTELVCYSFLCDHFKDDDVRFERLRLREAAYGEIVTALMDAVKSPHVGNEKYWAPAEGTIPELDARYRAAMKTLQDSQSYRSVHRQR